MSCYTAGLHGYLAREWDAAALVGRSVRLAVRTDLPNGQLAFSHHRPALDLLPDGTSLRYVAATSPAAALPAIGRELAARGAVIAVTDSARLPWSLTRGGRAAPHWLLIDGRDADGWHVVDDFTALLAAGQQQPYSGRLSDGDLRDAMTLPPRWEAAHGLRNVLAFGSPAAIPAGAALWLGRFPGAPGPARLTGRWLTGDVPVLRFLSSFLASGDAESGGYLADIWAAAGHRSFAYRWRLGQQLTPERRRALELALDRWAALPRLIRTAVESSRRGRPRPTLVRAALAELLRAEQELSETP